MEWRSVEIKNWFCFKWQYSSGFRLVHSTITPNDNVLKVLFNIGSRPRCWLKIIYTKYWPINWDFKRLTRIFHCNNSCSRSEIRCKLNIHFNEIRYKISNNKNYLFFVPSVYGKSFHFIQKMYNKVISSIGYEVEWNICDCYGTKLQFRKLIIPFSFHRVPNKLHRLQKENIILQK